LIVGEKQFTAQIIPKGSPHVFVRRRVSPKQVYTIWENTLIVMVLTGIYRAPRAAFRKLFGEQWLYNWFGRHQGMPPKTSVAFRTLGKLIFPA
jgi:hypothetical protein